MFSAAKYYDLKKEGLGKTFIDTTHRLLDIISTNPQIGKRVYREIREMPIKNFPFSILYDPREEYINVVAIRAHRRSPEYWLDQMI